MPNELVGAIEAYCENPACPITRADVWVDERAVAAAGYPVPERARLACPNCAQPLKVRLITDGGRVVGRRA